MRTTIPQDIFFLAFKLEIIQRNYTELHYIYPTLVDVKWFEKKTENKAY